MSDTYKARSLTRRHFVVGASIMALSMMTGCAPKASSSAAAAMKPGTYTAEANGLYGPYTIEVEVSADSILDVRVITTHESQYMGQRAQATIAANVIERQSVEVDSISGATMTTTTMKDAIRNCLSQAGASDKMFSDDETSPAPINCSVEIEEFKPDIIVVGAGITGISAALTAADAGAKVLILDHNEYFGGSTMYSGGYCAAAGGTTLPQYGYTTDADAWYAWFLDGDPLTFRPELSYVAAYNSAPALDMLTKYGAQWVEGGPIGDNVGAHASSASSGNSTEDVEYFAAYVISHEKRGLSIFEDTSAAIQEFVEKGQMAYLLNTKATDLVTDASNHVIGVRTEDGTEFKAAATILSCGGYCNNPEMLSKIFTRWARSGSHTSIGNMFDAALKIGATLHDMDVCRSDGGTLPMLEGNGQAVMREIKHSTPGMVWLSTEGKRFWAEGSKAGTAYFKAKDNTIYCVANKTLLETGDILYYGNYATYVTDSNNEELERIAAEGKVIFKGETIEEAAEKAGLDPQVVAEELKRYNEFCAKGIDEDFGKAAESLIALEEGPFYIFDTIPNVKNTYGGLVIDDGARVVDANNQPIVGLYAAGETAGNYNIVRPSASYYGGNLHRGATFGYTAAMSAVSDFSI